MLFVKLRHNSTVVDVEPRIGDAVARAKPRRCSRRLTYMQTSWSGGLLMVLLVFGASFCAPVQTQNLPDAPRPQQTFPPPSSSAPPPATDSSSRENDAPPRIENRVDQPDGNA